MQSRALPRTSTPSPLLPRTAPPPHPTSHPAGRWAPQEARGGSVWCECVRARGSSSYPTTSQLLFPINGLFVAEEGRERQHEGGGGGGRLPRGCSGSQPRLAAVEVRAPRSPGGVRCPVRSPHSLDVEKEAEGAVAGASPTPQWDFRPPRSPGKMRTRLPGPTPARWRWAAALLPPAGRRRSRLGAQLRWGGRYLVKDPQRWRKERGTASPPFTSAGCLRLQHSAACPSES